MGSKKAAVLKNYLYDSTTVTPRTKDQINNSYLKKYHTDMSTKTGPGEYRVHVSENKKAYMSEMPPCFRSIKKTGNDRILQGGF